MSAFESRTVRYQGAIVRDDHLLVIHCALPDGRHFWLLPGGGREDESEEECVAREMLEETHLVVRVERFLYEADAPPGDMYRRFRTYLCHPVSGEARPGIEPEAEAIGDIDAVQWLDLRRPQDWDAAVRDEPLTFPQLEAIRRELGYGS